MFFDNGLAFECQRCSACCRHEPGVVFLRKGEPEKIASYLNISSDTFFRVYCRILWSGEGERVGLREKSNYDCIFWTAGGCEIYPVRPIQCRTYPFWPHILESDQTWKQESSGCPGIGRGRIYSSEEIRARLLDMEGELCDGSEF